MDMYGRFRAILGACHVLRIPLSASGQKSINADLMNVGHGKAGATSKATGASKSTVGTCTLIARCITSRIRSICHWQPPPKRTPWDSCATLATIHHAVTLRIFWSERMPRTCATKLNVEGCQTTLATKVRAASSPPMMCAGFDSSIGLVGQPATLSRCFTMSASSRSRARFRAGTTQTSECWSG